MRKVFLASALLVALALLIAPALAAPPTYLSKVTWKGSGIAENGAHVKFSGSALESANGIWTGKGTFIDRDNNLVATYTPWSSMPPDWLNPGEDIWLVCTGDVTVGRVTYYACEIHLILTESPPKYEMIIAQSGGDPDNWLGHYVLSGDAFKGSIRIT